MFKIYIITSDDIPTQKQKTYLQKLKNYPFKKNIGIQFRFNNLSNQEIEDFIISVKPSLFGIKLLVNNNINLMEKLNLDGVHLKDLPINFSLKKYQKQQKIILKSTHSLNSILEAQSLGFNGVTYGPIFDTPSKRKYGKPNGYNLLKENNFKIPVFSLGGINKDNIKELKNYFYGIAGIRFFINNDIIENLEYTRRILWK